MSGSVSVPSPSAAAADGRSRPEQSAPAYDLWIDDPAGFSTDRICSIKHSFQSHPLMQLPSLASAAKALMPTGQCRFIAPGTSQASAFNHTSTSPDARQIDEVFARIEEPGSWVALYNIQTHPPYRAFVEEVASRFRPLVEREQPGIYEVSGFVFISAPPSVTPFHIDRENNFWLQVRGRKTMNVWDHHDRTVVPPDAVDDFIVHGDLDRVRLKEEYRSRSRQFETVPGDGVYFPSTSPHMTRSDPDWVQIGDGVSISIGVVFYSSVTRQQARVHAANRILRRLGLTPKDPSGNYGDDRVKEWMGRAIVAAHQKLRGWSPPKGF